VATAVVVMTARLFGPRVAGVLAGLLELSVPTLLWLPHEQGSAFAEHTAAGNVMA